MGAAEGLVVVVDDSPLHGRDRMEGFTRRFDEVTLLPTFPFIVDAAEELGTDWILASESESNSKTSWGTRTAIFRFLGGCGFEPFVVCAS